MPTPAPRQRPGPPPQPLQRGGSPQGSQDLAKDSERVLVGVRVRPLTDQERAGGESWLCASHQGNRLTVQRDQRGYGRRSFAYDRLWWSAPGSAEFHSQEDVYRDIGQLMLDHAFAGYNTCIFAYGQTSSGKTYTMMGDQAGGDESRGIIPRACFDLFRRIDAQPRLSGGSGGEDRIQSYQVTGSYYEIYNERVYDLLDPSKQEGLRVREHPVLGPYVEGLRAERVALYEEVLRLMQRGNRHRHTNCTKLNERSSRSHAIFTLTLQQTLFKDGELTEYISKINLVDLAGSERTNVAGTTGEAFVEGVNINRSLANLGQVIHNLAERDERGRDAYINFRDSQLTWLLRENLGGNSKTIMVATVSPAARCIDETLNTLRYADRVKQIRQRATVNEDSTTKLIRDLRQEVARLRKQNMELGRLRHELGAVRSALQEAEGRAEAAQLKAAPAGPALPLPDGAPYFVVLRPNPQGGGPALLRLSHAVTLITDAEDQGLPAGLPQGAARLCPPGAERRAAAVHRAGDKSSTVFGTRRCELQPLQADCKLLLPRRAASVTATSGGLPLSHGCVVVVGALWLRFADPSAEGAADALAAACEDSGLLGGATDGGKAGAAAPSNARERQVQTAPATASVAQQCPCPDGAAGAPAPSSGVQMELRAALGLSTAAGRAAEHGGPETGTAQEPVRSSADYEAERDREGTDRALEQAAVVLQRLSDRVPPGSAEGEQLQRLANTVTHTQREQQRSAAEAAELRRQLGEGESVVAQLREERSQQVQLLQLKVLEATKEAEAKDSVIEGLRTASHREREAAEAVMQRLEAERERAAEEAAQEHARRLAEAEEQLRHATVEREQLHSLQQRREAELQEALSDSKARAAALSTVLRDTEVAVGQEKERKEQAEEALQRVRGAYDQLIGDVSSLRRELQEVAHQKQLTEQEKQALERRMQEVEQQHRERIERLGSEYQDSRQRLEQREAELQAAREREQEMAERLRCAEQGSAAELAQKQRELAHLQQLAVEKELAAANAEAQCGELMQRCEGAAQELTNMQAELEERRDEVQRRERELAATLSERDALQQAYQREARQSEEQNRQRQRAISEHVKQIGQLNQEITALQKRAAAVDERNRELFQRENQVRETKQALAAELTVKERELADTRGKYNECFQRLQAAIRKGQKETKLGEQLRRLTQSVKDSEARIAFLEKELNDTRAHARHLEATRAEEHTQEEVRVAKCQMMDVMARLRAEVVGFTPVELRHLQTIANSVQHAADPRKIFRQAFNSVRLVIKELSGREQESGKRWNIEEQHFAQMRPFHKAAALKALREMVVWHGLSPDYARPHCDAYTELGRNADWLVMLARTSHCPSTFCDVTLTSFKSPEPTDSTLRALVQASRRASRSRAPEQDDGTSPQIVPPDPARALSPEQWATSCAPPPLNALARSDTSNTSPPAPLTQRTLSASMGSTARSRPVTGSTRSRSPLARAHSSMLRATSPRPVLPVDTSVEEIEERHTESFRRPTLSSQSKEHAERPRYPLTAHARASRGLGRPGRMSGGQGGRVH